MSEVLVWVRYSSMDKYPSEAFTTIEGVKDRLINRIGFDPDDANSDDYDEEIGEEWESFKNGAKSFHCSDLEMEIHRIKLT